MKVVTDPLISQFSGYGADFQAKNQLQSDMEEISVLLQFDKLLEPTLPRNLYAEVPLLFTNKILDSPAISSLQL